MNCDELLRQLNEYVDGPIDPGVCEAFEKHPVTCNPCQVVVDNIRKTISLYREGQPVPLPDDLHSRLHAALRSRWRERRPN